jgi:hypothetical protein
MVFNSGRMGGNQEKNKSKEMKKIPDKATNT